MRENLLLLNMNAIRSRNLHDFFNDLLLWHNSISLSIIAIPNLDIGIFEQTTVLHHQTIIITHFCRDGMIQHNDMSSTIKIF